VRRQKRRRGKLSPVEVTLWRKCSKCQWVGFPIIGDSQREGRRVREWHQWWGANQEYAAIKVAGEFQGRAIKKKRR